MIIRGFSKVKLNKIHTWYVLYLQNQLIPIVQEQLSSKSDIEDIKRYCKILLFYSFPLKMQKKTSNIALYQAATADVSYLLDGAELGTAQPQLVSLFHRF